MNCIVCGEETPPHQTQRKVRKYCSIECTREHFRRKKRLNTIHRREAKSRRRWYECEYIFPRCEVCNKEGVGSCVWRGTTVCNQCGMRICTEELQKKNITIQG